MTFAPCLLPFMEGPLHAISHTVIAACSPSPLLPPHVLPTHASLQGTGFEFMEAPWLTYEAYDLRFTNNIITNVWGAGKTRTR